MLKHGRLPERAGLHPELGRAHGMAHISKNMNFAQLVIFIRLARTIYANQLANYKHGAAVQGQQAITLG